MRDPALAELNLEPATDHDLVDEDQFIVAEVVEIKERLGWNDAEAELLQRGPEPRPLCDLSGLPPWDLEYLLDDEYAFEESRYRELLAEAVELRRREQERGQWAYDQAFETAPTRAVEASACTWSRASSSRRSGYRGGRRRIVRATRGSPDRPRSTDDDPEHLGVRGVGSVRRPPHKPEVALARAVAA